MIQLPAGLEERLLMVRNLPTLPEVATRIMELVQNERSSMVEIARVIHHDPAIAAKVLAVANSAYYGLRQHVTSLQLALAILGIEEIKNIVISLSAIRAFGKLGSPAAIAEFWTHSAGCAHIARRIAERLGYSVEGEAFVGGLLHDIGKILIFYALDREYKFWVNTEEDLKQEREKYGADHALLGGWLAQTWGLHSAIVESIGFHHNPSAPLDFPIISLIVHLSDVAAKAFEAGENDPFSENGFFHDICRKSPQAQQINYADFIDDLRCQFERGKEFYTTLL